MGAMFCVAAKRPLLLSNSTMFSCLEPYTTSGMIYNIYRCEKEPTPENLRLWVAPIVEDGDKAFRPDQVVRDLSWEKLAHHIKALWERVAR